MQKWAYLIRLASVLVLGFAFDYGFVKVRQISTHLFKPLTLITFNLLALLFLVGLIVWLAFFSGRERLSMGLSHLLIGVGVILLATPFLLYFRIANIPGIPSLVNGPGFSAIAGAFYLMLGFITAAQKKS